MQIDHSDILYDIAIIGGGIAGAAIARDAALRGLSVVLLENSIVKHPKTREKARKGVKPQREMSVLFHRRKT